MSGVEEDRSIHPYLYESKGVRKRAGELTPNDIDSLIKVRTTDGVEIQDILRMFVAGDRDRWRRVTQESLYVEFEHTGKYDARGREPRLGVELYADSIVVVKRPKSENQ